MEYLPNGYSLELVSGAFPLSTDSMVLSHFVRLPKNARVLDLGSGCGTLGLLLYVDGARLGYALASPAAGMTLPQLAARCDAFYIGGTKMGALFGEALIVSSPVIKPDFRYILKQHGGMLAKGRLLGVQFEALLADGLYFEIGARANAQAMRLREAFEKLGVPLRYDSPTNQQFPILPDSVLQKLSASYAFSFWERMDDSHAAVRFCTGWATEDAAIDALIRDLQAAL